MSTQFNASAILNYVYPSRLINYVSTQLSEATLQEVATASLPFLSMYKPLSRQVAIATGSIQTVLSIKELVESIQEDNVDRKKIASKCAATCFSTLCVAGTLFAGPAAMLLTSGQEIFQEVHALAKHIENKENDKALESCKILANHILYSLMLLGGGSQVAFAYFGIQALTAFRQAMLEYKKENYITASGHALMALMRSYEFFSHTRALLQEKNVQIKPAPAALEKPQAVTPENCSFDIIRDTAQYKGSDYTNAIAVKRGITLDKAFKIARTRPDVDYFVYSKGGMSLEIPEGVSFDPSKDPLKLVSNGTRTFKRGDAVFFKNEGKWLGSAPGMANTYVKTQ
jgi:hypothetical protein